MTVLLGEKIHFRLYINKEPHSCLRKGITRVPYEYKFNHCGHQPQRREDLDNGALKWETLLVLEKWMFILFKSLAVLAWVCVATDYFRK